MKTKYVELNGKDLALLLSLLVGHRNVLRNRYKDALLRGSSVDDIDKAYEHCLLLWYRLGRASEDLVDESTIDEIIDNV